jgi:hypothetical protein
MSERGDISPNARGWRRLSYTKRCGWIDWGHALPGSALELKRQMQAETGRTPGLARLDVRLNGYAAYALDYGQAMGRTILGMPLTVSATRHWVVQSGLKASDLESAALGIFLAASHQFESLQGAFPFGLVSGASSYSPEDLVSNLVGFYAAFRLIPQSTLRGFCGEVSVKESFRIWDEHLPDGFKGLKNKTTRPILFPSDENPKDTAFPALFMSIAAAPEGGLWVRPKGRFIDGRLVNSRTPIDVDRDGTVRVRKLARTG